MREPLVGPVLDGSSRRELPLRLALKGPAA